MVCATYAKLILYTNQFIFKSKHNLYNQDDLAWSWFLGNKLLFMIAGGIYFFTLWKMKRKPLFVLYTYICVKCNKNISPHIPAFFESCGHCAESAIVRTPSELTWIINFYIWSPIEPTAVKLSYLLSKLSTFY